MTTTARHFAHNDRRRILELEKRIDRLVIALARYGCHLTECATRRSTGALTHDEVELNSCHCGLTALIETRGEM